MTGPLAAEIGFLGTSPACRDILNGTYTPPPGTDQYTSKYFDHLRKPLNIKDTPTHCIPTDKFCEGWKR